MKKSETLAERKTFRKSPCGKRKQKTHSDQCLLVIKYKEAIQGLENTQFQAYVSECARNYNQIGMQLLNQEKFKLSSSIFKVLIKVLQPYGNQHSAMSMMSLTLNNMSCCYKRTGKIKQAQRCLEKALLVQQNQDVMSLQQLNDGISNYSKADSNSLTELNLCAIYSQLNDHVKGKQYAEIALKKIKQDLEAFREGYKQLPFEQKLVQKSVMNEKVSLLAISYYNLGSQHEFLMELSECIRCYEEALHLVEENLDKNCQLASEFKSSLKQARNKQIAHTMKGGDRTFSNLNKNKVMVMGAVMGVDKGETSFGSTQHNSSLHQIRQINQSQNKKGVSRPMSAQVPRNHQISEQQTNPSYHQYYSNNHLEEISENNAQLVIKQKKARPTSSYVRTSYNTGAPTIYKHTTSKKTINIRGSHNDSSYDAIGIYNDNSSVEQNKLNNQRVVNSQFSPSIESRKVLYANHFDFISEEDQNDRQVVQYSEQERVHPLMMDRDRDRQVNQIAPHSKERQFGAMRPASAKTNMTSKSNLRDRNSKNNFFSIRGSKVGLDSSLEKIYCSNEMQLKELRHMNNLKNNQSSQFRKPPTVQKKGSSQFRGARQGSQSRLKQNASYSQQPPKFIHDQSTSKTFLNDSGYQGGGVGGGGRELFQLIDKNFDQIVKSSKNERQAPQQIGQDLNTIYSNEQLKQQKIFYHNNEVLPTYAHMEQLPRFPPKQRQHQQLSNRKQKDEEIININIENTKSIKNQHHPEQNQRRQKKQSTQGRSKGATSISPHLNNKTGHGHSSKTSSQFMSFGDNKIHPIMNDSKQSAQFQKRHESKKGKSTTLIATKDDGKSQERRNKNLREQLILKEDFKELSRDQMLVMYNSVQSIKDKRLQQYNSKQSADSIIYIQKRVRAFLARQHFKLIISQKQNQQVLHKTVYKSQQYGFCNLFFNLVGKNMIEVVMRSVKTKQKVLQRQYTFDELDLDYQNEQQVKKRILEIFGNLKGDIYKDFFDIHKPVSAIGQLLLETQRNMNASIHDGEQSFVKQLDDFMATQRSQLIHPELQTERLREEEVAINDNQEGQALIGMKGNESMLSEIRPSQDHQSKQILKGEQSIIMEEKNISVGEKSMRDSIIKGKLSIRTHQDYAQQMSFVNEQQINLNQTQILSNRSNIKQVIKGYKSCQSTPKGSEPKKIILKQKQITLVNKSTLSPQAKEEQEVEAQVVKIQAVFRGKKARQMVKKKDREVKKELLEIKPNEDKDLEKQVVKIQSAFRGVKVRKETKLQQEEAEKEQLELQQQALKIQSVFRGQKIRKQVKQIKQEQEELKAQVVKIQSVFRGKQQRDTLKKQKEQEKQEQLDLEQQAIKIQAVFRGTKAREKAKQIKSEAPIIEQQQQQQQQQQEPVVKQDEEEKLKERDKGLEQDDMEKQVLKIQSVFRGQKARQQMKTLTIKPIQDSDKELIYIYQADIIAEQSQFSSQEVQQKAQINLYMNKTNRMIILKSEVTDTLALLLENFLSRYRKDYTQFQTEEQCYSFLREQLPKVTQIQGNRIMLLDPSASVGEQPIMTNTSQDINFSSMNKEELNDLFRSSTLGEQLTIGGMDKSINQGTSIFQQPSSINPSLVVLEKTLSGLKFGEGVYELSIIVFKDMIQNIFTRIRLVGQAMDVVCVERISIEKLELISGKGKIKDLKGNADVLFKELEFRIGMMNSGLEGDEVLHFKDIHKLLQAYSFRKAEHQLQNLQDIEANTIKIQKAFRSKSKNKKDQAQVYLTEISNWKGGNNLAFEKVNENSLRAILLHNAKPIDQKQIDLDLTLVQEGLPEFCREQVSKCLNIEVSKLGKGITLVIKKAQLDSLISSLNISNKKYIQNQMLTYVQEEDEFPIQQSVSPKQMTSKSSQLRKASTLKEALGKQQSGIVLLLKERQQICGIDCIVNVKLNYDSDSIMFKVTSNNNVRSINSQLNIDESQLKDKTLKTLTNEVRDIMTRLEIDKKNNYQLILRANVLNDYSILSTDIVYKKGLDIQGRFFIVTVAIEDSTLVIDAYEEKTDKRLELRIKRNKHNTSTPTHKDIEKIVNRIEIRTLSSVNESNEHILDQDEILVLKA